MNDRFSKNGDGKNRPPKAGIPAGIGGQKATQSNNLENDREQHVITTLTERYDEIEALWNEAEEDLKRFHVPYPVVYWYATGIHEESNGQYGYGLGFVRYGKGWRICHGEYFEGAHPDEPDWKPVIECPVDIRIKMMGHFETLRKKVIETAENAVPKLDKAIASFRKVLKG